MHSESTVSGVPCVSSGELISQPFWQMLIIQDPRKMWLATGSLLTVWRRMLVSGAEIAPCLQALDVTCLPFCLQLGEVPVHSCLALLWYSLNALFCEQARLCIRLEPFSVKFSLFFLALPQFGLLSHVSSLRLSPGLAFTLSLQPAPPCAAPAHWWQMQVSGLLHWELWLGAYSVFFFFLLLVMLPSEIPKLLTDPLVRGFPVVWKLLLHNSLQRTGLHP